MKVLKISMIVIVTMILILSIYIYTLFNGLPWEEVKFKKVASRYVMDKYEGEVQIIGIDYDFKSGLFFARAYSKNHPQIKFDIYRTNVDEELRDDYVSTYWKSEIKKKIDRILHEVYTLDDFANIYMSYPYTTIKYVKKIPEYQDVPDLKAYLEVYINIHQEFNNANSIAECEKLLKIINFMKDEQIEPRLAKVVYHNENSRINTSFTFRSFENIATSEDILKFRIK